MQVIRCDNKGSCERLAEPPGLGWVVVGVMPEEKPEPPRSLIDHLAGQGLDPVVVGTFCSWQCVAEYATAKALISSAEGASGE